MCVRAAVEAKMLLRNVCAAQIRFRGMQMKETNALPFSNNLVPKTASLLSLLVLCF
jgi:hypothetical protein